MHEVPVEIAGNLIPVSVSVSADIAIPVEADVSGGGGGGGGLTNAAKDALLQIARKVVYVDAGGATYYNALYEALYPLSGITAVYTQSGTVYDTDTLDDLKADLVVTAHYSDGGTATVTDYTLSGTLTAGTSTITVAYGGKTTTFTVTVTHEEVTLSYIEAVYVQGAMVIYDDDPLTKLQQGLTVTAYYSDTTSAEITAGSYTLSGTLTPGTSTITVTYEGKTDTFDVTVTASSLLPAGYTQYDYVVNKTPAIATIIDTGIDGSYCGSEYAHELDFLPLSGGASTSYPVYGCRQTTGSDPRARAYWVKTSGGTDHWACNFNATDTGWTHTMTYNTRYDSITAEGKWTVNSVVWETMTGEYTPPTVNIRLFGINTGGTDSYARLIHRIYKFKIWNTVTDTPVAEFIPCTNPNGVAGFYDIVRNVFVTAQTTPANLEAGNDAA